MLSTLPDGVDPLEALLRSPAGYGMAFLLGALWGSFANVCIARLPRDMSVVTPGSHCFACGKPVRWFDNLPILSWLLLRGRCRACQATFSPRYMLVEAATGLLFVATWHHTIHLLHADFDPASLRLARFGIYAFFELVLVVITFIDLDHKKIYDRITYPAIPLFLGMGLLLRDTPWLELVIGVVVGYGIVRLISDGYWLLTKREGMGYGDGKLLAIVGALFGWRAVLFALFGGSVLGSVIGVSALVVARRRAAARGEAPEEAIRHVEIPFGPFLAAAALIFLFLQDQIGIGFSALWSPSPPE